MTWYYEGAAFEEAPNDYIGFVYEITEVDTGKKYIGKKLFWGSRKIKGKRKKIESDWKNYYGSSKALHENITKLGTDKYKREILYLCKTRGAMSYLELKEQVQRNVLFRDDYYNEFIGGKIHSKHVRELNEDV